MRARYQIEKRGKLYLVIDTHDNNRIIATYAYTNEIERGQAAGRVRMKAYDLNGTWPKNH